MKTPDFVLTESHSYRKDPDNFSTTEVEAGTFVRPIDKYWVPKFILEDPRWANLDHETMVFCYFSGGIVPFPRKIIRQV